LAPGEAPDISATLSADGKAVILFAVNATPAEASRTMDLSAFGRDGQEAAVWTLADRKKAGEPDVANSFADPERVAPVQAALRPATARFTIRFPALSLTVIRWLVGGSAH